MKYFKKSISYLLLILIFIPTSVLAYSKYLIPGGENVAIEVNLEGVLVVGLYDIDGKEPALEAGLKIGDTIISVNNEPVKSIDNLMEIINKTDNNIIEITYVRNNKKNKTKLTLTNSEGVLKTGLYVKDSLTGIGTLTYIDPETKLYGALGHEIIESNTGIMLEVKSGNIYDSEVINIERSENGNPGSKIANLKLNNAKGTIFENTSKGIFGKYTTNLPNKDTYEVATLNDIKLGKASIYTVVSGNEVEEYKINILNIYKDSTKNILFEITDPKLLKTTGGIIQGMSGSPIIQGNYIIGAVTHVIVENPNRGYGILITNMLEEAEN